MQTTRLLTDHGGMLRAKKRLRPVLKTMSPGRRLQTRCKCEDLKRSCARCPLEGASAIGRGPRPDNSSSEGKGATSRMLVTSGNGAPRAGISSAVESHASEQGPARTGCPSWSSKLSHASPDDAPTVVSPFEALPIRRPARPLSEAPPGPWKSSAHQCSECSETLRSGFVS